MPSRRFVGSLRVARVVEQYPQLDAAMSKLRKVLGITVPRVEIGGRVIRWKQNQGVQKLQQGIRLRGR